MKDTYKIGGDYYDTTNVTTKYLDITALTLKRWVAKKVVPEPIKISGRYYYNRRLIDEALSRLVMEGE